MDQDATEWHRCDDRCRCVPPRYDSDGRLYEVLEVQWDGIGFIRYRGFNRDKPEGVTLPYDVIL